MTLTKTTSPPTTKPPENFSPSLPKLRIARLDKRASLPFKKYATDVGWDIFAYCLNEAGLARSIAIAPQSTRMVPTRLVVDPPTGFCVKVYSRSGFAKESLFVANAPGLIDPGYNGELQVLLFNGGYKSMLIHHDMKIAQLVVEPITYTDIEEVDEIKGGDRGAAGFGSTGTQK